MALSNLVAGAAHGQSEGGWRRNARAVEVALVAALTVTVAVAAALWGGPRESSEGSVSVSSLEAPIVLESEPAVVRPMAGESEAASGPAVEASGAAVDVEAVLAAAEPRRRALPSQSGIVPGRPDPSGPARPDSFERYQVQRGESLSLIAGARGVTVAELVRWNWHLEEDSQLLRGEWIWIPQRSAVAGEAGAEERRSGRGGG